MSIVNPLIWKLRFNSIDQHRYLYTTGSQGKFQENFILKRLKDFK